MKLGIHPFSRQRIKCKFERPKDITKLWARNEVTILRETLINDLEYSKREFIVM